MNTGRFATPGKTRTCPHCKATILDSATVCPGCQHHLRFDSTAQQVQPALTALRVEGMLRHSNTGGTWEYSVVLTIRDRRGQEIARQVVGVGALQQGDERAFTLAVEVFKPAEIRESKPQAEAAAVPEVRAPGRPPAPPRVPLPPAPAASAVSNPSAAARPAGGSTRPATSAWGLPPRPQAAGAPGRDGSRAPVSSSSDSKPQPKRP
jgi:hypothetical protein